MTQPKKRPVRVSERANRTARSTSPSDPGPYIRGDVARPGRHPEGTTGEKINLAAVSLGQLSRGGAAVAPCFGRIHTHTHAHAPYKGRRLRELWVLEEIVIRALGFPAINGKHAAG